MKLNITVEGDSPIEIAMLLKGMVAKQVQIGEFDRPVVAEPLKFQWHWPTSSVAQVGDQTFIWYDEVGAPGGVAYSLEAAQHAVDIYAAGLNEPKKAEPAVACTDSGRFVEYKLLYENGSHELARYGDCLYVVCADGIPVWCGHSETEGRKSVDARERATAPSAKEEKPVATIAKDPDYGLPNDFPYVSDPNPKPAEHATQTKVAGPGFAEPLYEDDTKVVDPQQPVRPTVGVIRLFWPLGTRCQYGECTTILRDPGRKRQNGYCAAHRNS